MTQIPIPVKRWHHTWKAEALVVAAILASVVAVTGGRPVEWLGALAVLVTFFHAQVSFRLAEAEVRRDQASVDCHRWLARYHVSKEVLWLGYFVWLGAWSALVGVGVFLVYPLWRRFYSWRRLRHYQPRREQLYDTEALSPAVSSSFFITLPSPLKNMGFKDLLKPEARGCADATICEAAKVDGIACAPDECDYESGVRKRKKKP